MPPSPSSPQNVAPETEVIQQKPPHKKSFGPIFGIVIILALLIVGAFYLWGARLNKKNTPIQQVTYIPAGTTTLPDITR